jgi:hypothetical protein
MLMPFANYGKAPLEKLGDDWVWLSTCECIVGGLKTHYLAVSIVPDPMTMKWHKNMVLKHNFSDTAEHVFHRHTENLHETISHLVNETNKQYGGLNV